MLEFCESIFMIRVGVVVTFGIGEFRVEFSNKGLEEEIWDGDLLVVEKFNMDVVEEGGGVDVLMEGGGVDVLMEGGGERKWQSWWQTRKYLMKTSWIIETVN